MDCLALPELYIFQQRLRISIIFEVRKIRIPYKILRLSVKLALPNENFDAKLTQ